MNLNLGPGGDNRVRCDVCSEPMLWRALRADGAGYAYCPRESEHARMNPINVTGYEHRFDKPFVGIDALNRDYVVSPETTIKFTNRPGGHRKMKAKVMQVHLNGKTYLVEAQTRAGAVRDVLEHITDQLRKAAHVDLATGEQIYNAGMTGEPIIGSGRFKRADDPNQIPLAGVPDAVDGANSQEQQS